MTVTPQTTPPLADVRALPAGDKVTGFYLLAKLAVKQKRDGAPYLTMTLQDSTARLEAKMWEGFEEFQKEAKPGDVIKVAGVVDRYREIPSLNVTRIRAATAEEVPDRRQYLPHSSLSDEEAAKELDALIASVESSHLRTLLDAVFTDEDYRQRFLEAPGGKLWHHSTLGGLAEHTIGLAKLADHAAAHYTDLNRDLLVTGALLHDCGKVFELSSEAAIDYTSSGRLIGHIVQGVLFLERKLDGLPDFPPETRKQLLHLILSHQGDGEKGSPVKPMTLEALTLHYLDELDSRINAFRQIRETAPDDQDFSDYVRLMDRFFYFKTVEDAPPSGAEDKP